MPKPTIRKLSIAIVFASLFVVLSFIPIGTSIIGGKDSFKLAIVLPPVVGWFLGPYYGVLSMIIGFIAGNFFSVTSTYGPLGVIIPMSGALFAGLNKKGVPFITSIYLILFSFFFFISYPTVWWFILPHIVASCCSILILLFKSSPISVFFNTLSSTFSQHATGTFLAILLLSIRAEQYYLIFPLTIYERTVSSVGALILILAIGKRIKTYFVLS